MTSRAGPSGARPEDRPPPRSGGSAPVDDFADDPDCAPILIVDDNPANLLTYRTVLDDLGEPIHTADSGETALRKLLSTDFAVILLDVNLPGISGFETAALIRQRKRSEHTPIIFASAISVEDTHAHRGYSLGGVDYILAPIVSEVLKTKVRVFVELHRQRRAVQRQAEQLRLLQEAQHQLTSDQLRLALEAGRMGVWELDLTERQINWSPIPGGVAGVDPATVWTTLDRFVAAMPPDEQVAWTGVLDRCRVDHSECHFEPRLTLENGESAWVEIRARLRAGQRDRLVGIYLDITDRKLAEQKMRRALDSADEANRAKDRFLAMLSHELRTPLTPALLAARAWQSASDLPPDLRRDLTMIADSIRTESRLIDDLLDLTAISRGSMSINRRACEFREIVQSALLALNRPEDSRRTEIRVDLPLEPMLVDCDATRIQQIIWNLVGNALKFTPDGGRIEVLARRPDDERVVLEIRDNGVGIKADDLQRIFEPFERAAPAVSRAGGLGLGLAITRAIVELHGGRIQALSDGMGRGTTMRVDLPAVSQPAVTESFEPANPDVVGLRILLVEDHASTADVLSRLLKLKGHSVQLASSVEAALSTVAQNDFDLLISDVGLPDGTGFELLQHIRRTRAFPAIALTGYGAAEDVRAAKSSGFAAHLAKPADLDDLQAAINRVVLDSRSAAAT